MACAVGLALRFAMPWASVLLLSQLAFVGARRDADATAVEVSGTHFVAQKESDQSGAGILSEIREHRKPSTSGVTPDMRQQIAAFSKLAVQALANGDNPDMSHEEKAKNVQLALAQATNAMSSLASHADIEKNPVLAQKLSNLQALTAPSLIQKRQEEMAGRSRTSTHSKITPEMHKEVVAFGKAAVQALAHGKRADMSHDEKAKTIHRALAQAANALLSITSVADMKNSPELAHGLVGLKEITKASLLQKRQDRLGSASATITADMHQKVVAFGKAAVQALANGRNAVMTPDEKAASTQAALVQAANAILSITSATDLENAPEFAQKLANLKELVVPSLIQKRENHTVGVGITSEMREQVLAFSSAALAALGSDKNGALSDAEKADLVQAALSKAAHAMTSVASLADLKKGTELADRIAYLKELSM